MEHRNNIKAVYTGIITDTKAKLSKVQNQIYRISTIRLILFVAGVAGVIYFWSAGWLVMTLVVALTFIPFLILVKYHNSLFYKKDYLEMKIKINEQELQALDGDFSSFDEGDEFINPAHLYTYDLDVFGRHSLFQAINRTSTAPGKTNLAGWLNNQLRDKDEIMNRQEAIRELAPDIKFRQRFRISGLLYKGQAADKQELIDWAQSPDYYRNKPLLRMLPYIVMGANIILFILAAINVITFGHFFIAFSLFFLLSLAFSKGISKVQSMYGKKMKILGTYAKLIQLIEERDCDATLLKDIKKLVGTDKKTASQSVNRLSALMNALDQRSNMFMLFFLNGSMFWELRQVMRIEAWKNECAANLPEWLEAIAQFDTLCSCSTFAYNNPDYSYPVISTQPFEFTAQALGHPLMNRNTCVRNDINIRKRPFFIVITGANMAGKSTYLRTVGVNFMLACTGLPVCADSLTVYPAKLVTSLRTTDSLTDNESYFFAELKRLKMIIDMLNAGEELFIILDEILKGTNSIDKQKGSIALINQFMELNANGIIATHDLMLGTLIERYPDNIRNYRFEADITNNELTFSYQLREGVAQNMNACFLMKKMGIAVAE